ncbi:unnamed protein product [Mesocestoides corti]|uniref:carbonic anhydrase n=1 Tax=Mesocestoides corti TaxID=53468 RepID=A0A0R3UDR1_MESCO|nr:unnamed protein product [Mesocestoides corti]
MHIVTYNKHLYNSMLEASDKANGLAVVALFFEEKEDVDLKDTQLFKMSAFLRSAEAVRQPNTSVKLAPFPGEALLDIGKDRGRFYRYEGSLTTPPCTENVVWTVMNKVLPVHPQQVEMLIPVGRLSGG